MFNKEIYISRREALAKQVCEGIIIMPGNGELPRNFKANTYFFVQDSNFLYYAGIDDANLVLVIDCISGKSILFGNEITFEETIWMGKELSLSAKGEKVGIDEVQSISKLEDYVRRLKKKIHFLPTYRTDTTLLLSELLQIPFKNVDSLASDKLIKSIISQREIKDEFEIKEMEVAHSWTRKMHLSVMKYAQAEISEFELVGTIKGIAVKEGGRAAYPPILTVQGQVLHNFKHRNKLRNGQLLLGDFGAESTSHYSADITRTIPVSGQFDTKQKQIYQIVLDAQRQGIEMLKEGVLFIDIHLSSCLAIANGLKDLGLMKGDMNEAVSKGVHALFFPHGLGHMIGLDVHDMESLGEVLVGYDDEITKQHQFGLKSLRLGKRMKKGFVVTIEPGIYFIPELIEEWKSSRADMHAFLNFNEIMKYVDFGGIRIEDECVITENGNEILGAPLPKTIEDIESTMAK